MASAYPWIKAFHVISVILWMGAQLLLPALLIVHRNLQQSSEHAEGFLKVERWLVGWVMNPAMVASFVFGGFLVSAVLAGEWQLPGWLGFKLGLVFVMAALHGRMLRQFWQLAEGQGQWGARQYRLVQMLQFALLAGIVLLVVIKPFS